MQNAILRSKVHLNLSTTGAAVGISWGFHVALHEHPPILASDAPTGLGAFMGPQTCPKILVQIAFLLMPT
jgi:hypothetical protein